MGYSGLRACAEDLRKTGRLRVVDYPVDPYLEMAALQRRAFALGAPALLFTRPKGARFPMLANLFGTRERVNYIFRDTLDSLKGFFELIADPARILSSPRKALAASRLLIRAAPGRDDFWETRGKPPVLAETRKLSDLPGLVSWAGDGGAFVTLPIVQSEDSRGRANLGAYRVQLTGNDYNADEIGLHYQINRGVGGHHAEALAAGRKLPVHVYAGGPPALAVAAVMPLPEGVSEIFFASLLAGEPIRAARIPGFALPVLERCDFLIKGVIGAETKPEGPFGDHLGYYSLRHPFPVMKVQGVWSAKDAIWPFTSVGRPPQEDTVFGDLIHELTAPLVAKTFPGVEEIRAVDEAGVHPLLLAIGRESYVPWEGHAIPRELITLGLKLLGSTQTSLAKYVIIAARASGLSVKDAEAFFAHVLARADFRRDLHFLTGVTQDTLDYTGDALNEGSKLIWTCAGETRRELAREIRDFPELPEGFFNPAVVAPGILALGAGETRGGRADGDSRIGELARRLGAWSQRDGFPLIVLVDDPVFCAASFANFLWLTFTRSDPGADVYGFAAEMRAKRWTCEAPLIIDSRLKPWQAPPLEEEEAVIKKLEKLAVNDGPLSGLF